MILGCNAFVLTTLIIFETITGYEAAGTWSEYGDWSPCTVSCAGMGSSMRKRTCQGGSDCTGSNFQVKKCDNRQVNCPRHTADTCQNVKNELYNKLLNPDGLDIKCLIAKVKVDGVHKCMGIMMGKATLITLSTCVVDDDTDRYEVETLGCDLLESKTASVKRIVRHPDTCDLVVLTVTSTLFQGSSSSSSASKPSVPPSFIDILLKMIKRIPDFGMLRLSGHGPLSLYKYCGLAMNVMGSGLTEKVTVTHKVLEHASCRPSWDPYRSHFCARVFWNIPSGREAFVYGSPVLVASQDRIYLVGLVAAKCPTCYNFGIFNKLSIASVYHCYHEVGCALPGFWSTARSTYTPTSGDQCDCEEWWKGQVACGGEQPLCTEHNVKTAAQNPAYCPSEQFVEVGSWGFRCKHARQQMGCRCHDYEVRYMCNYLIDTMPEPEETTQPEIPGALPGNWDIPEGGFVLENEPADEEPGGPPVGNGPPFPGPGGNGPPFPGPGGNGPPFPGPGGNGPPFPGPGGNGPPFPGPGGNGPPFSGPGGNGPPFSGPGGSGPSFPGPGGNGPPFPGPGGNGPPNGNGPPIFG